LNGSRSGLEENAARMVRRQGISDSHERPEILHCLREQGNLCDLARLIAGRTALMSVDVSAREQSLSDLEEIGVSEI
jgi:hypothetical protein